MKTIPVVFATDEKFVPYCGVAIYSLICNANPNNKYEISVLYDEISDMSINRLEHLSNEYAYVKCICIHENIKNIIVTEYGHLTIAAAYRIISAELFSDYGKILYIDSDTVICDDVSKLYESSIGDNILGAANALVAKNDLYYKNVLSIDLENYFNSGVLLINTESFINNRIKEKCIEHLKNRKDFQFMDQDALNISCQGKVQFIDKRWNYEWMFQFGNYEKVDIIDDPGIIHYDSIEKPWTNPGAKYSDIFWKYARETVFYEEILQKSYLSITGEVLRNLGADAIGKDIAIYGAGYVGKRFARNLKQLGICNVCLWVDRDYQDKKNEIMTVNGVDALFNTEFDFVLITIHNTETKYKIKEMLIEHGIEEHKIKLIQ